MADDDGATSRPPSDGRMTDQQFVRDQRLWTVVSVSMVGLLVAIAAVSIVAIVANERVREITERAIGYDVEIEDEGDDLRAAVLDLRHYHRNIAFGGPSVSALADFEEAYAALLEEIDELEALGVERLPITQPAEMRRVAAEYYAVFRPAIDLYATDPAAFTRASETGLGLIRRLGVAADELDTLGEQRAADSLIRVDQATTNERIVLFMVLGGVVLVGAALAFWTSRVIARLRVSAEREQTALRQLALLLETKNDFIADASHELRTPLTVIRGNADIGLATPGEPIHQEVLSEISAEAARMGRLVEDLLFLARSDAGMPPLEREYVPVRWLLSRIKKPAESLARQRGTCLTTDLAAEGHLEVDPVRLEQAVLNLVDNAAKHSPDGACVALTSRVRNGELIVEVADQGPGIPSDELPMIFDRFYQIGRRRARRKGGSGLGLAIVRTIVEAHGGQIEVDSRTNRGTKMTIRLPLSTEDDEDVDVAPAAGQRVVSA
jgi:two-component system, OmpR family, sensor histidine kinase VicK